MTTFRSPQQCQTMAQLRKEIDAIDVELIALLRKRTGYIDRAVDLKRIENLPARTTDRVAEVLDKVSATAADLGLDPALARNLWAEIIEWSIQRESRKLGN